MLGLGRASEYAGWWNTSLSQVKFSSTSTMTPTIRRGNSYSFATRDTNSGQFGISGISPAGSIDISGVTGYTGYNRYRSTNVVQFYIDGTTWAGYGNGQYTTARQQFINNSGTYLTSDIGLSISGTSLIVNSVNNLTLPSTASSYYNKWITVVISSAETSSVFTSWAGGTSTNTVALRVAAYNPLTGALISKTDGWVSDYWMPGNFATDYNSTLTVGGSYAVSSYITVNYGTGTDSDTNNPLTPIGGYWYAWGTMFDPLSATDTSWKTAAPSSQIGQAVAFMSSQFTGWNPPASPGPFATYYNTSPAGTSLYSQSIGKNWLATPNTTAHATAMYSNTILIGNN